MLLRCMEELYINNAWPLEPEQQRRSIENAARHARLSSTDAEALQTTRVTEARMLRGTAIKVHALLTVKAA